MNHANLGNLAGGSLGGGLGMTGLNSMMPLGGLVPESAMAPPASSAVVDMLEIPGKGRCSVFFARYNVEDNHFANIPFFFKLKLNKIFHLIKHF